MMIEVNLIHEYQCFNTLKTVICSIFLCLFRYLHRI